MKKSYLIIGLFIVVGAIIVFSGGNDETANVADNLTEEEIVEGNAVVNEGVIMEEVVVAYTDQGFEPRSVTVSAGAKVTFENNSNADMWPATAIHPTHRVYPGSDIEKCGTPGEVGIFDACRGIAPGSSYSFTFNEIGTWNYHNHLNPTKFGSVVVEAESDVEQQ